MLKNYGIDGIRDFYSSSENIENAKNIYQSDHGIISETNNFEENINTSFYGSKREFFNASFKSRDKTFAQDFLVYQKLKKIWLNISWKNQMLIFIQLKLT